MNMMLATSPYVSCIYIEEVKAITKNSDKQLPKEYSTE